MRLPRKDTRPRSGLSSMWSRFSRSGPKIIIKGPPGKRSHSQVHPDATQRASRSVTVGPTQVDIASRGFTVVAPERSDIL